MSTTGDPKSSDEQSTEPQAKPEREYESRPEIRYRHSTAFQQRILKIIAVLGRPYGLEIKRHLQDHYEEEINHGRLYPNLDTLVEQGFVEKGAKDRRTNYYTLTQTGERVVTEAVEADHEEVCEQ